MKPTHYKVVDAFGDIQKKGTFCVLLFTLHDNMSCGVFGRNFPTVSDAEKAAEKKGLKKLQR